MQYTFYTSPIGRLLLVEEDGALTMAELGDEAPAEAKKDATPILLQAKSELDEYFAGKRKNFTVPLRPRGTPFQQAVWQVLRGIPYGQTRTYGQVAAATGNPKAARAAGMGCNRNPLLLFTPCHRVVGANGALTGFAAGLPAKKWLLALEQNHSAPHQG